MESISLTELAAQQLAAAREAHSGRAARTVHGGRDLELRQTVLALVAGQELAEHNSPGEATLHVLHGRARLTTESDAWEGQTGDFPASSMSRSTERAAVTVQNSTGGGASSR